MLAGRSSLIMFGNIAWTFDGNFSSYLVFTTEPNVPLISSPQIVVHGDWSEYGDWTECSGECGIGSQIRSRTCTDPEPEHGGNDCPGEGNEERSCYEIHCPGNVSTLF